MVDGCNIRIVTFIFLLQTGIYVCVLKLFTCKLINKFLFFAHLGLANRFEEYPKLRELIRLKDELISTTNTPPM